MAAVTPKKTIPTDTINKERTHKGILRIMAGFQGG